MKSPIKLSVITICYNEKQIEKTCQSIVNQTWQDFEWIVIDGGSTDGTLDILKKYKDRIDIFISESDTGIYNAQNKGIALAHGEYLNFMNGGDAFFDTNVLENVFQNSEQKADILYGNCCFIDKKHLSAIQFPKHLNVTFWLDHTLNHQASFIKKKLFDRWGKYDESYKIAADKERFVLFFQKGAVFKYIPYYITLYDLGGISARKQKESLKESEKIRQKYLIHSQLHRYSLMGYFHWKKKKIFV